MTLMNMLGYVCMYVWTRARTLLSRVNAWLWLLQRGTASQRTAQRGLPVAKPPNSERENTTQHQNQKAELKKRNQSRGWESTDTQSKVYAVEGIRLRDNTTVHVDESRRASDCDWVSAPRT